MTLPTRLVSASLLFLSACSMPMNLPDAGRPGRADAGITMNFPVLPAAKARKVVVGAGFACALTTTGTVRCWGSAGQPRDPVHPYSLVGSSVDFPRVPMPVEVPDLAGVEDIDATYQHVCVVVGGAVQCWGSNDWSKLGTELPTDGGMRFGDRLTPIAVNGVSGATKVATGDRHTCALLNSGGVRCWGGDFAGQLLNRSTDDMRSHVPLDMPGIGGATDLAAFGTQTCAIVAGGAVKCWGMGPVNGSTEPVAPFTLPLTGVTSLGLNRSASCAVENGAAKCWGVTDLGLLGNGSDTGELEPRTPVQVAALASGVTNVTRQCAVAGGAVKCWGRDGRLLGNASTRGSTTPVDAQGITDAVQVSSNTEVTCAVTSGGLVWCWGDNVNGAVGNGFDVAEVGVRNYAVPQRVLSFE